MSSLRVLWVCGPSGVGKSTVAWDIFHRTDWSRAAYVDIDQLGLRYPSPPEDPFNEEVKVANLAQVIHVHAGFGARHVVVSGIATGEQVHRLRELLPGINLTVCRLRADEAVLSRRFTGRPGDAGPVSDVLDDARRLDASDFADMVVDTSRMTPDGVADRIVEGVPHWAAEPATDSPDPSPPQVSDGGIPPIVWLHGPRAVGSSTVGFALFLQLIAEGRTVAYTDLAQVGFRRPSLDGMNARDLSVEAVRALGSTYRAHGAQVLILVGAADPATVSAIRSLADPTEMAVCRLTADADADALAERVAERARGGPPHLAGDDLRGVSQQVVERVAAAAHEQAVALDREDAGATVIDTSAMTVDESVSAVRSAVALAAAIR